MTGVGTVPGMTRTRTLAAAALVLALAGCGSTDNSRDTTTPPAASANPAPTPSVDPYEAYLKLAPKGETKLSREDAQARAFLGCGQSWAPGTVDAALAEAYGDLCKRGG